MPVTNWRIGCGRRQWCACTCAWDRVSVCTCVDEKPPWLFLCVVNQRTIGSTLLASDWSRPCSVARRTYDVISTLADELLTSSLSRDSQCVIPSETQSLEQLVRITRQPWPGLHGGSKSEQAYSYEVNNTKYSRKTMVVWYTHEQDYVIKYSIPFQVSHPSTFLKISGT